MTSTQELTRQVINLLGGPVCTNPACPIPREKLDIRAIVLDHIHGKGDEDRRRFTKDGTIASVHYGWNQRKYLKYYLAHPDEAKKILQTLCVYCDKLKAIETRD